MTEWINVGVALLSVFCAWKAVAAAVKAEKEAKELLRILREGKENR